MVQRCCVCIVSYFYVNHAQGLKLSYTVLTLGWLFNVILTSTGHKKPLHLHMIMFMPSTLIEYATFLLAVSLLQ